MNPIIRLDAENTEKTRRTQSAPGKLALTHGSMQIFPLRSRRLCVLCVERDFN
jgi:hypothetical protein